MNTKTDHLITFIVTNDKLIKMTKPDYKPFHPDGTPNEIQSEILYQILFNFTGTITLTELSRRLYLYILPYWNDDGYTALVFERLSDPLKSADTAIERIESDLLEYLEKYPSPPPDTAAIKYKLAQKLVNDQIE